jgi:uncharacterized protein involved in exopolysaccharide biosynthesis
MREEKAMDTLHLPQEPRPPKILWWVVAVAIAGLLIAGWISVG